MDEIKNSIKALKCCKMKKKIHYKCRDWLVRFQCPLIIEEHEDGVKNTPYFCINFRVYKAAYAKIEANT